MGIQEFTNSITSYIGGTNNISNQAINNQTMYITVKNRSIIELDTLKSICGESNVELARNRLKIKLEGLVRTEEKYMAKIDYKKLADDIVRLVGSPSNIEMVTHCVTRLRFQLKDESIAKSDEIKELPGVLGVVFGMSQYQVVLGENIFPVYDAVIKNYDLKTGDIVDEHHTEDLEKGKKNFKYYFSKVVTFMAQSLTPFITVLYGAGMLRVVMTLCSYFKLVDSASSTYKLFNIVAQTPFYFMPVLIAYGTSKVLKSNPVFAMTIALSLVYPDWTALVSAGESVTLFGIGVKLLSYSSSLLPAIFAAILCAYLEKFFYKRIPGVLRSVFAPLCVFIVAYPITLWILGPIGNVVGTVIVNIVVWLEQHSGGLAPGLIACAHPFLVMMGVNMLMVPPMTELFTTMGYDNVFRPGWILHNIAEGGSCFAVMLKTKDGDLKSTALSSGIGALVSGVSEPALYGIGMRFKTPIIGVALGGLIGGAVAGILGAKAYSMGYSSILGIVIFEDTMFAIVIAVIVAFVASFITTFVLFKDEKK